MTLDATETLEATEEISISVEDLGGSPIASKKSWLEESTKDLPVKTNEDVRSQLSSPRLSATEERAIALLGTGIPVESVASALGVTPGRISQLLAEEEFSTKVTTLRYNNLKKHNERDGSYDSLEDKLLKKLEDKLPLMFKPETILKAIQVVNGAKRRGQSAPEQVTAQQNIVQIVLPTIVTQQFKTNINNQVTRAGEQELLTMPAGQLLEQTKSVESEKQATTLERMETRSNEPANRLNRHKRTGREG